jgi:hypothetical protein
MELIKSKVAIINILTVIDPDAIIASYDSNNHDKKNPQKVDLETERMICSGSRGIVGGQGTADLNFRAKHGDYIYFRGISTSDNSEDAIIIYNIKRVEGDSIFKPFTVDVESIEEAVVPNTHTPNGLPPLHEALSFSSLDSRIKQQGTAVIAIQFGLYQLDDHGEKQQLYGYFEWDARITIS